MGYKQHYRVKHFDYIFANRRSYINVIENFWGPAKIRIVKFRGIHKNLFYLHLKETKYKVNHKHDNLYLLKRV